MNFESSLAIVHAVLLGGTSSAGRNTIVCDENYDVFSTCASAKQTPLEYVSQADAP